MADAGRIGFVLKGNYDNTIKYERLDVITHNNVLYAAKRDTIGNAPTGEDDDNWKVLVKNQVNGDFATKAEVPTLVKVDGDTITKDTDGTLQGSAKIEVETELSEESENPLTNAKTTIELGKKAPKEHTHDELYYSKNAINETVNAINEQLDNKSDAVINSATGNKVKFTIENGIICAREA